MSEPHDVEVTVDECVATRDLSGFSGAGYDKGRGVVTQTLWMFVSSAIFRRWWLPNRIRLQILRAFGASIGRNVIIRHNVQIHWPWKLTVGDSSWIGVGAWILNLEHVSIGSNVCVSQEVLLCTGSHDRRSPTFEFDNGPIVIADGVWVACRATILRGVSVGRNAVVGATALVSQDIPGGSIVRPVGVEFLS